jgi:hypothetical protein
MTDWRDIPRRTVEPIKHADIRALWREVREARRERGDYEGAARAHFAANKCLIKDGHRFHQGGALYR